MEAKIINLLSFLQDLEKLKNTLRHSWTSSGRHESVAEHTFQMTLMAFILQEEFPEMNMTKVIEMCLIHDLGEVYHGDTPAFVKKAEEILDERKGLVKLVACLPQSMQQKILDLWDEFEAQTTLESKLAKALDKMEVLIQHNLSDISTWIPVEYEYNVTYAEKKCSFHPFIKTLRAKIREITEAKISAAPKLQKENVSTVL